MGTIVSGEPVKAALSCGFRAFREWDQSRSLARRRARDWRPIALLDLVQNARCGFLIALLAVQADRPSLHCGVVRTSAAVWVVLRSVLRPALGLARRQSPLACARIDISAVAAVAFARSTSRAYACAARGERAPVALLAQAGAIVQRSLATRTRSCGCPLGFPTLRLVRESSSSGPDVAAMQSGRGHPRDIDKEDVSAAPVRSIPTADPSTRRAPRLVLT